MVGIGTWATIILVTLVALSTYVKIPLMNFDGCEQSNSEMFWFPASSETQK